MEFRGVSIQMREHDDGEDIFLVFHDPVGGEQFLEWDFVLEAVRLRYHDAEAYDVAWHLIDVLNDRELGMEGLNG
jgi:hypothetical protein